MIAPHHCTVTEHCLLQLKRWSLKQPGKWPRHIHQETHTGFPETSEFSFDFHFGFALLTAPVPLRPLAFISFSKKSLNVDCDCTGALSKDYNREKSSINSNPTKIGLPWKVSNLDDSKVFETLVLHPVLTCTPFALWHPKREATVPVQHGVPWGGNKRLYYSSLYMQRSRSIRPTLT